jgi:hypothetical protein
MIEVLLIAGIIIVGLILGWNIGIILSEKLKIRERR